MSFSKPTGNLMLGASLALALAAGPGVRVIGAQTAQAAPNPTKPASTSAKSEQSRPAPSGGRQNEAPGPQVEWEWWADADAKAELKLSEDQARKIKNIYEKWRGEYSGMRDTFLKQRESLDKMTRDRIASASDYQMQVRDVERSRSTLAESRTLMLYRLYLELNPAQYTTLKQIRDRHFSRDDNRGPSTRGAGSGSGR